jgi:uncharacterized LabA/DUF88 family protein
MINHLSSPKHRVAVYFDGLNVMFRLRESGWEQFFDVGYAARKIAGNRSLEGVYYFTARPSMPPIKSQQQYWNEIAHLDRVEKQLYTQFGRYVRYGYMAPRSRGWEEKRTDAWIAAQMIADGWANVYDIAILASADTDLVPPVDILRYFNKGTELVVFPRSKLPAVGHLIKVVNSITTARPSWFRPY